MNTTAVGRYSQLETTRSGPLRRARDGAALTIPALLPPSGNSDSSKLTTPYQSVGSRGVNNLASKLLLSLFPPNAPFFKFSIDEFTLIKLTENPSLKAEVDKAMGSVERSIMLEIESIALRSFLHEALKQLIVAGNVLVYMGPGGKTKVIRMDRYVIRRDPMGEVLEIVIKESVAPSTLPPDVLRLVAGEMKEDEKVIDLYTSLKRAKKKWEVFQEVKGHKIPSSRGSYPLDKNPWIPLRMSAVSGEDWGRSIVEEYYGDLTSLEVLSKAIVQGSAAAAKVLMMVNPNGSTDVKDVSRSESGDIISGHAGDVTVLQLEKYADFRIAAETRQEITTRLSFAFMLNSAVQRNAERVTAEEIRLMASELEDTLGGLYSVLSQDLQLPVATLTQYRMEKEGRLPKLPDGVVKPSIVTGLEAIGRGNDLTKLDLFLKGIAELFGPEAVAENVNVPDYITRRGTALGIDTAGLVRTQEEIQQERQNRQMQEMTHSLGPKAMEIAAQQQQQ